MLKIRLLGPLTLEETDKGTLTLPSRKAEALLAYLACQERPLARETLATIFWDSSTPEQALANLRKLLSALRKKLRPYLNIDRQTVAFNRDTDFALDTIEFLRLLATTRPQGQRPRVLTPAMAANLETAVSLYGGDFLDDLHLPDSRDFEAWASLERERYRHQFSEALRRLVQHFLQHRAYKTGIRYARQLLALDPLSELAHRQLMLLLARSDQIEAALAQYHDCRRILADELGVAPVAATQQLFERIKTAVSQPVALPEQITPFIGRDEELAHINRTLDDPTCRLLTLTGPGGIGKTRLALQTAADRVVDYLHGVTFVSVTAVDSHNDFLATLAEALNFPLAGAGAPGQQLLSFLRQKEMLLVLDNCETLLAHGLEDSTRFVLELLQQAPQLKVLATSRERFNFQLERVLTLTGLPTPQSPAEAPQSSAVRLFVERARAQAPGFTLNEATLPSVVRICQLVEGMPLALELAAAAVADHDIHHIETEIAANLDFLAGVSQDEKPERHLDLRAVFDSSWTHLLPAEQAVFRRLSVFRNRFTAEAAVAVAETLYVDLLSLVDKSMLWLAEDGRYHLHDLLRQYAGEKLTEGDEEEATRRRHADYYCRLVETHAAALNGPQVGEALDLMQGHIEDIRQAWQWAVAQPHRDYLARSLMGISRFYQLRGPFQEGVDLMAAAAQAVRPIWEAADSPDPAWGELLVDLLTQTAVCLNEQADSEGAIAQARAALAVAETQGLNAPHAYLEWGRALVGQGEYTAAQAHLETAIFQAHETQRPLIEADSLRFLGVIGMYLGEYERSRQQYTQALQIQRRLGNRWAESGLLNNLGIAAKNLGQFHEAQTYYEQSLQIARAIGERRGQSRVLLNQGSVLRSLGDYAGARQKYEQALRLKRELGERHGESLALNNLGNLQAQQGDYAAARACFEQALQIYEELGRRRDEAMVRSNLGLLHHLLGEEETAVAYSQAALNMAAELGDRSTQAFAAAHLGHSLLGLARLDEAEAAYRQSLSLREEMGETMLALESRAGLARVALAAGDKEAALVWVEPILARLSDHLQGSEQPYRIYLTCYRVLATNDRNGRAQEIISRAHELLQAQAAQIPDEAERRRFLQSPIHRQIVALSAKSL